MPSEPKADDSAADRRVGTVLNGKWTIERRIGQGGMAVVYAARHRNKKRAAIKMLLPELSADPGIRERFLREGYVANTVDHVGAVRVDDDDTTEDGAAYLVMELLEGETVQGRWERSGCKLGIDVALAIADQLLAVLVAAHAVGVVHRDLKPDNLYLTRDGTLKVLDFGIARLREAGQSSRATRTGSIMGTPMFMAPEQARGRWEQVDPRTDLWAVGALLFTLIAGRPVHLAETANETLALACIQRARSIRSVDPNVPEPIAELIDRALCYEVEARFADAASMRGAMRGAWRIVSGAESLPSLAIAGPASTASTSGAGSDASSPGSKPGQVSAERASSSASRRTPARVSSDSKPDLIASARAASGDGEPASQSEVKWPPTRMTAALSNDFGSVHKKRNRRIAGAAAATVLVTLVTWLAVSGRETTSPRPAPSQVPLTATQPVSGASLNGLPNGVGGPTVVPVQAASNAPVASSAPNRDTAVPTRREKKVSPAKTTRPPSLPAKPAAKGNDPMSLRR
jgi:eukaryotic-like serine/threonine-protein kinase